jgi:putative FmdB family regulatory protein
MPVYTYRCENCGIQFDQKQGYDDPTMTVCPECEEEALHRVYRPVGIVFKGSGFYATDNRSPSGQKTRSQEEDSSAKKNKNEKNDKKEETKTVKAKSADTTPKENKTKETKK